MNVLNNNNNIFMNNDFKSDNELENIAFNEITDNCSINIKSVINKLNKDSKCCIKFILNNNDSFPDTFIPVPFIKNIYEIVTRYQQIIDQFDLVGDVEDIKIPVNNKNLSKMHYLLMYLYINENSNLRDIIDESFTDYDSKKQAINYIENIDKLSVKQLSEWLEIDGKIFSKYLQIIINNSTNDRNNNSFIQNLYDIGVKNNLYNDFISSNIQDSIERNFDNLKKFKIIFQLVEEYNTNTFTADIIQTDIPVDQLKYYFAAILLVPVLVNNQTEFKFECWHSMEKKKLSKNKKKTIGPEQVNTGVTLIPYTSNDSEVNLFRHEEMHKVIIHESLHATKSDFSMYESDVESKIIKWIFKHFKIPDNTIILINESYAELWGIILNTIITAHHVNPSELLCTIKFFVSLEKLFSCFQCAKILHYFEFDNFNDFYNPNGWSENDKLNTKYNQTSSIFSYYFLKAALLYNVQFFLKFSGFSNISNAITFKQTENNMKRYFKLIIMSLNDPEFIRQINYYMDLLKNNKKKGFEYDTLRMTCVDFLD
jgi:hypothetical protein